MSWSCCKRCRYNKNNVDSKSIHLVLEEREKVQKYGGHNSAKDTDIEEKQMQEIDTQLKKNIHTFSFMVTVSRENCWLFIDATLYVFYFVLRGNVNILKERVFLYYFSEKFERKKKY